MLELPGACCAWFQPLESNFAVALLLIAIVGADGRLGNSLVGACHWEAPA